MKKKLNPLVFINQLIKDFHHTGAIFPSSSYLAQTIVREVAKDRERPVKVLEVGAGTGAFTEHILENLHPSSELDIYECNRTFVEVLEEKVDKFPQEVHIFPEYIQGLDRRDYYDYIVCGLPFNNFEPGVVREIFDIFASTLVPGGTLSFFEYVAVRPLKKLISSQRESNRVEEVGKALHHYIQRYTHQKAVVYRNLPPARVWFLTVDH